MFALLRPTTVRINNNKISHIFGNCSNNTGSNAVHRGNGFNPISMLSECDEFGWSHKVSFILFFILIVLRIKFWTNMPYSEAPMTPFIVFGWWVVRERHEVRWASSYGEMSSLSLFFVVGIFGAFGFCIRPCDYVTRHFITGYMFIWKIISTVTWIRFIWMQDWVRHTQAYDSLTVVAIVIVVVHLCRYSFTRMWIVEVYIAAYTSNTQSFTKPKIPLVVIRKVSTTLGRAASQTSYLHHCRAITTSASAGWLAGMWDVCVCVCFT